MALSVFESTTWKLNKREFALPSISVVMEVEKKTAETKFTECYSRYINSQKERLGKVASTLYDTVRTTSDPFDGLCSNLRKKWHIQNCNRGWLKMYEMLTIHQLLLVKTYLFSSSVSDGKSILALFNCELPGGFLSATHHFARKMDKRLIWWASSLDPKSDTDALDDSYNLVSRYPDRWLMTSEIHKNGDMTDPRCVQYLVDALKAKVDSEVPDVRSKVNLYVSDGGMDIKKKYANQEFFHQSLILGELLVCVQTLNRGGNAVIKLYTFCTDFMRSLIAIAGSMFEETTLYKPLTSRPVNTEIYLILKYFKGTQGDLIHRMTKRHPDVTEASQHPQAADALLDMRSPKLAGFISGCLIILDSLCCALEQNIGMIIWRTQNMAAKKVWKNRKMGPIHLHTWSGVMDISELRGVPL